ncbi:MAG: trypsin-like peptidase domain-containing protein [Clostridia bacterium]|nr:trypsin-like peptidase domain-containing protein [Clostridia bacterium]
MITNKMLQSVFRVRFGNKTGSAFTIEYKNLQYIVTAKHLFSDAKYPSECNIQILRNGRYESVHVLLYYHINSNVDAVVLKTTPYATIAPLFHNEISLDGIVLGQDVYFLGFPYNYDSIVANLPNEKTPTPFVKKAILSGFTEKSEEFFLDGINNPGFSGGLVCFKDSKTSVFKIAGVINSYRFDKKPVLTEDGSATSYYICENTGIIHVCSILTVLSILEQIV